MESDQANKHSLPGHVKSVDARDTVALGQQYVAFQVPIELHHQDMMMMYHRVAAYKTFTTMISSLWGWISPLLQLLSGFELFA